MTHFTSHPATTMTIFHPNQLEQENWDFSSIHSRNFQNISWEQNLLLSFGVKRCDIHLEITLIKRVDRYTRISVRVTRYATRLPWMCSNAWDVPFNLLKLFFISLIYHLFTLPLPNYTQIYGEKLRWFVMTCFVMSNLCPSWITLSMIEVLYPWVKFPSG